MRIRGLLPLVIVLCGAVIVAYLIYQGRAGQTATAATSTFTQIVEAKQGTITANITVVGELDAVQSATLTFSKVSGTTKLATLDVKAGNTVKAGQTLATIDPAAYKQAVDQALSDLQAAEQKLADMLAPVTALAIARADLAVAKAELQAQQSQNDLDIILDPDIASLQVSVVDAQRALTQVKLDLAKLQTDTAIEDKLWKLRDTEAKASANYTRLVNEATPASDALYQDRLVLALNALKNAEDGRIAAEIQQQVDLIKAQMQVRKTEQTLASAQEALATAQGGGDKLALAKAQLAVREAEVSVATAKDARTELGSGADATTLAAARASVDKKRLALADAEAALAAATIVAPFDGTVLQTRATPGSLVGPTTQIMTVANLKNLQVMASVDETSIRRVQVGQNVQITFDAFAGQTLRGKVLSVPLQGALQGNVMVYEVPVSLTGAENLPLLVGMTANARIQVGQASNALLVPTMALQESGGRYQVLVPNAADPAGEPQAVAVEVGLSDGTNTQITKGLNVGDKVVVRYTAASSGSTGPQFGQGPGQGQMIIGTGAPPPAPGGR